MTGRFGTLLRQLRRQAGMTQEHLAERSGVAVRTIRRLETGAQADPRVGTVKLLADALDITTDERRTLLSAAGDGSAPEPPSAPPDALTEAADQFARVVGGRWQREEEHRRIHDPFPLPVRWEPVPAQLIDHWNNICRAPAGATSDPLDLAGELEDIADTYRRIPSGRLVVLGRAGSGKTVLTIRFVLDYLRTRASTDPVPVIFSLGSWDPTTTPLRDWLAGQLLRDYPGLAVSVPGGSTLAAALVDAAHILPVLDGFDEIADGLHRPALEALNATALPLLLTSRPDEYARAVAATDVLTWTAGVELVDLTPADLVNYLPRATRPGTVWDPILDELREHPDRRAGANLAAALSTPLMVVLARAAYADTPGQDPAELLDATRFPTREALEDHLLGSFVPAVYRQRVPVGTGPKRDWEPARVRRWLGYLAHHLDQSGTRDLAWWQLGSSLSRCSRIFIAVLTVALAAAAFNCLVFLPVNLIDFGTARAFGAVLLDGVLIGPVVGLAFGLVYGHMIVYGGVVFDPARVRLRLRWPGRTGRTGGSGLLRTCATRFTGGLIGGFAVGLGYGPATTVTRGLIRGFPPELGTVLEQALINTLGMGLVFGLAAGSVFAVAAALETPLDISTAANPTSLLAANRATVLRQALVLAMMLTIAVGFGGRLVIDLLQPMLGPLVWDLGDGLIVGAVAGATGGLAYAFCFTAWGQWAILSRGWLPLTGRLPWALTAFLDDAYQRGVLRQAGAVYQFRHARLQDQLSRDFQAQQADSAQVRQRPRR